MEKGCGEWRKGVRERGGKKEKCGRRKEKGL